MKVDGRRGPVYSQIHRLFGGATIAGMDEERLLERFVARSDEAAFEALVARFGPTGARCGGSAA